MTKIELKRMRYKARYHLNAIIPPYRTSLIKAAYRVSKHLFSRPERIEAFYDAIIKTAPKFAVKERRII
jgi:hypothetical protein